MILDRIWSRFVMRYITLFLISCICVLPLYSQSSKTENTYSVRSFRRGETASKYKYNKQLREEIKQLLDAGRIEEAKQKLQLYFADKIFPPTYDELRSSDKGVSLSDWTFHMLPRTTFDSLNTEKSKEGEEYLTEEELNADPLMGAAERKTQNRDSVIAALRENKVDNYQERLKRLDRLGYDIKDESFYVDPNDPRPVGTKTYVGVKNGEVVVKKVPLDEYVLMLIKDEDEENPTALYVLGLILIVVTGISTFVISKFT